MQIKVLEDEKNKMRVQINDTTFVNMLNERLWIENESTKSFDYSSFTIDHPYLSQPVLSVKASNPSKTITSAAESILKDIEALKKQVSRK